MKIEWGVEVTPDFHDGPNYVAVMPNEETADEVCGENQCVVFRYVGDWTRADESL